MMRTLDRYVAREFARLFLIFIIAAPLLFIIGDWTERIDTYTERGLPITRVALGYLYQMPMFIAWSMPVAALIATVFTVNSMTRHSELAAAKAGGVSFFRALAVLPLLGILLTALGLVLTEMIPAGTLKKKEALGEVERQARGMRNNFIYSGPDGHVFAIRRLSLSGDPRADGSQRPATIGGMTIEHPGNGSAPPLHITARTAAWDTAGGWTLRDGIYRVFTASRADADLERAFRFRTMRMASFTETPDELMARVKEPEEMGYAELGRFIETLERSGDKPRKLMVERAQKLAIPAATLVIILFGAPLATSSGRGGAAFGIGLSLAVTILYMMLFKLTGAAGVAGMMDPMVAAWIPNALFMVAAVFLLARVRT